MIFSDPEVSFRIRDKANAENAHRFAYLGQLF